MLHWFSSLASLVQSLSLVTVIHEYPYKSNGSLDPGHSWEQFSCQQDLVCYNSIFRSIRKQQPAHMALKLLLTVIFAQIQQNAQFEAFKHNIASCFWTLKATPKWLIPFSDIISRKYLFLLKYLSVLQISSRLCFLCDKFWTNYPRHNVPIIGWN